MSACARMCRMRMYLQVPVRLRMCNDIACNFIASLMQITKWNSLVIQV